MHRENFVPRENVQFHSSLGLVCQLFGVLAAAAVVAQACRCPVHLQINLGSQGLGKSRIKVRNPMGVSQFVSTMPEARRPSNMTKQKASARGLSAAGSSCRGLLSEGPRENDTEANPGAPCTRLIYFSHCWQKRAMQTRLTPRVFSSVLLFTLFIYFISLPPVSSVSAYSIRFPAILFALSVNSYNLH